MPAFEKSDPQIIVMQPGVMPLEIPRRRDVVLFRLFPSVLSFCDFAAKEVVWEQNQWNFEISHDGGDFYCVLFGRSHVVCRYGDPAEKNHAEDSFRGDRETIEACFRLSCE